MELSPVEQPDLGLAVELDQIAVLLVRQRLDRCRVERSRPTPPGELDAVLGDDGLAAASRCGDDDMTLVVEGVERLDLEPVERERVSRQYLGSVSAHDHDVASSQELAASALRRRRTTIQPTRIDKK